MLCLALFLIARSPRPKHFDIRSETRRFLDAYAANQQSEVLAEVTDSSVVYGSDASEVYRGKAAIRTMMDNDARLWSGTAHIGAMDQVSIVAGGQIQSIVFQAPFSALGRTPAPVRFCMVWRRRRGQWFLVQSSNVVPTIGQNAVQLLHGR